MIIDFEDSKLLQKYKTYIERGKIDPKKKNYEVSTNISQSQGVNNREKKGF